jgi:hypothetical protein
MQTDVGVEFVPEFCRIRFRVERISDVVGIRITLPCLRCDKVELSVEKNKVLQV